MSHLYVSVFGKGFEWNLPEVTLEVNDQIYWSWEKPPTVKYAFYRVAQTLGPIDEIDENGFISSATKTAKGIICRYNTICVYKSWEVRRSIHAITIAAALIVYCWFSYHYTYYGCIYSVFWACEFLILLTIIPTRN